MEYRQRYLVSCQSLALHREVLGTSDLLDTRIPRVEKRFFSFLIATLCCWHKILLQCHFFCMLYFSMQSIFFLNFRYPQLMLQKLSKFGTACQYNHCRLTVLCRNSIYRETDTVYRNSTSVAVLRGIFISYLQRYEVGLMFYQK